MSNYWRRFESQVHVLWLTSLGLLLAALLAGCSRIETQAPPRPSSATMAATQTETEPKSIQAISESTELPSTSWYVSKLGNNADGGSWGTAWNEMDQIDWSVVQAGDTVLLDGGGVACGFPTAVTGQSAIPQAPGGGPCGMVYESILTVGEDGVTILLSSDPDRDGSVVIFGGRSTPLPYCGQKDWAGDTSNSRSRGIQIEGRSNVTIDGGHWAGIIVYGHTSKGIDLESPVSDITIRNIEIFDNGEIDSSGPDQEGVGLEGTRITFERSLIHDNGQDQFQSKGPIEDFAIRESWVANMRQHPTNGMSFNHCRHADGIQIYGGGEQSGITIVRSIFGPGFTQALLLSGGGEPEPDWAVLHDVTIIDTLFIGSDNANILTHNNPTKHKNWQIERVTSVRTVGKQWWNIYVTGSGHVIKDSVLYGGWSTGFPDGNVQASGNCRFELNGTDIGPLKDPQFVNVDPSNPFSLGDFTVQNPECIGSRITSVQMLIGELPTALD